MKTHSHMYWDFRRDEEMQAHSSQRADEEALGPAGSFQNAFLHQSASGAQGLPHEIFCAELWGGETEADNKVPMNHSPLAHQASLPPAHMQPTQGTCCTMP